MASAVREAQQAFDSTSHIGQFKVGGMSGVGGRTRWFMHASRRRQLLQHYRGELLAAVWEVAEDDGHHLRAHLDGRVFDVVPCPGSGVIWAGSDNEPSYGQGKPELAGTEIFPHDL